MTPASSKPCPCTSSAPYRLCCGPYHAFEAEAPDPPALMRSRYAAFVVRHPEYLYCTLHSQHEDRLRQREEVLRDILRACQQNRYLGLSIRDHCGPDENGTAYVLFVARVFQRGRDLSFVERSHFQQEEGAWRYLRGEVRALAQISGDTAALILGNWTYP